MPEPRKGLVERLFAEHGRALQAFFYRRIRTKSDAPDLAQEVYVRMLRVSDIHAIRDPERYLYTVASNLVKEYAVLDRWRASGMDVDDASIQQRLGELPTLDGQLDVTQRVARLRAVLAQLPPKCRAAVVLQYRHGLSYREIGERLKVSPHMVKKYLAQGLAHCRRRMARME
jgi:RNA polymerase sigma-70 factor (ECF subfamily)